MKKLLTLVMFAALASAGPRWGGELRISLPSDPKTFNPFLVAEQSGGLVRYLTGGVLIRWNHATQSMEPELAKAWRISPDGRTIRFDLRDNAAFSDGTAVTASDVVFTFRKLLDPKTNSGDAEAFLSGGRLVASEAVGERTVVLRLSQPLAGIERLIGIVAIVNARALEQAADPARMPSAGPFHVAAYKPGSQIVLGRNPHYWKAVDGRRLPYLDSIRLQIRQDRSLEISNLTAGDLDLSNAIDSKAFARLGKAAGINAVDAGPTVDTEQLWFNQNPASPLPDYKKAWFRSREFRQAISAAINRDDLVRIVYDSHARPAAGIMPTSNRAWVNTSLRPTTFDPAAALRLLLGAGFVSKNGILYDAGGHAVEFSIVTNAGSTQREQMGALIQQDLQKAGIRVRVVRLDFPSLIERITRTFDYDACLLGLVNDDLDPNSQMNVWLSSGPNHPWFPEQKKPATEWEAEIDRLMVEQSREPRYAVRKTRFDRVQQIVAEQAPVIFLVVKNSLAAYNSRLGNVKPSPFFPYLLWNADEVCLRTERP